MLILTEYCRRYQGGSWDRLTQFEIASVTLAALGRTEAREAAGRKTPFLERKRNAL
jgi:hypothetical protein